MLLLLIPSLAASRSFPGGSCRLSVSDRRCLQGKPSLSFPVGSTGVHSGRSTAFPGFFPLLSKGFFRESSGALLFFPGKFLSRIRGAFLAAADVCGSPGMDMEKGKNLLSNRFLPSLGFVRVMAEIKSMSATTIKLTRVTLTFSCLTIPGLSLSLPCLLLACLHASMRRLGTGRAEAKDQDPASEYIYKVYT